MSIMPWPQRRDPWKRVRWIVLTTLLIVAIRLVLGWL